MHGRTPCWLTASRHDRHKLDKLIAATALLYYLSVYLKHMPES